MTLEEKVDSISDMVHEMKPVLERAAEDIRGLIQQETSLEKWLSTLDGDVRTVKEGLQGVRGDLGKTNDRFRDIEATQRIRVAGEAGWLATTLEFLKALPWKTILYVLITAFFTLCGFIYQKITHKEPPTFWNQNHRELP